MPTRRFGLLALGLLGASAALSAYATVRPPAPPRAGDAASPELAEPLPTRVPPGVVLRIGDPTTQAVVTSLGWDRDLPFRIEWAEITGGPAVTEAFHAKVLDAGTGMNIPPIHAHWVGIPVRMIAIRQKADWRLKPTFQLAIGPRSGIRTLADLRGKKIAYSAGQAQGELVLKILASQGISPRDVTLVEAPNTSPDAYINILVGGQVDAAPIGAGAPTRRYLAGYAAEGARVLAHGQRDDFQTVYVREEALKDPGKAAALRIYVQLWGRALAWQADHPDAWARLYYQQDQGLPADEARHVVASEGHRVVPGAWDEVIRLEQDSIRVMARETGRPEFDAAQLFDRRFEPLAAQAFAAARAGAAS